MTLSANPLLQLIPARVPDEPVTFVWAIVASVAPLQIQLDAETEPLDAPPSTLVQVGVGNRVYVVIVKRRATIVGRAGGVRFPDPPKVVDTGVVTLKAASPFNASTSEGVSIARYGAMVDFSAIVKTSGSSSGGAAILTLPRGYRPAFNRYLTSYDGAANVSIDSGGTFKCWTPLAADATVRVAAAWYTSDSAPS